jgi:hypothetical protein
MAMPSVVIPLEGIVFGADVDWTGLEVDRWSGVFLLVSTMMVPGGAVRRGPGGGRMMMYERRAEALLDAMVASTTGLPRSMRRLLLKMGSWKTEAATSSAGTLVRAEVLPDWLCHLFAVGRLVEAFGR